MARAASRPKLRLFHATMHVVRLEEWCVETETPEQARALFAAGAGHRCTAGECLSADLETLHEEGR
jgi:hypothetical protein